MNLAGLDLNLLVVLDAVIEERHVTRAATRLGLSQPATSNALKRLRTTFKDPLLVPGPDGMALTARARQLALPVRDLLNRARQLTAIPSPFEPARAAGRWRIGMSDSIAFTILSPLMSRLRSAAPNMDLVVRYADRTTGSSLVSTGEIDLLLVAGTERPAGLRRAGLYDEDYVCAARRGHPAFDGSLTLGKFVSYPHLFVSVTGSATGMVDRLLKAAGRRRRIAMTMPQFGAATYLLRDSDMIAVMARRVVMRVAARFDLEWREPPLELSPYEVSMLWHPRTEGDPQATWFRELVSEVSRDQ